MTMFPRRSRHRFLTAVFVVMSMLFSQLALASYVCPGQTDTTMMADMGATGEPCEGMDTAQPVLCHQHSASAAQSFELLKVSTPSLPAVIQVLVVVPIVDIASAALVLRAATAEAQPPPDPVFLSTLRLRV